LDDPPARSGRALSSFGRAIFQCQIFFGDKFPAGGASQWDSIASELKRGTFAATFLLGCLAALERDAVRLEEI
jgi:hypothetical protein